MNKRPRAVDSDPVRGFRRDARPPHGIGLAARRVLALITALLCSAFLATAGSSVQASRAMESSSAPLFSALQQSPHPTPTPISIPSGVSNQLPRSTPTPTPSNSSLEPAASPSLKQVRFEKPTTGAHNYHRFRTGHTGIDIQSNDRPYHLDSLCLAEPGSTGIDGKIINFGDFDNDTRCDDWKGARVNAAAPGLVTWADVKNYGSDGKPHVVQILHGTLEDGSTVETKYLHLGTKVRMGTFVKLGEPEKAYKLGEPKKPYITTTKDACVKAGQQIGSQGYSGWTTATHLHYEVLVGGRPVDPEKWFGVNKKIAPPTECAGPIVPNAPTNLRATAISPTQIQLQWVDNSDDETRFTIHNSWVNFPHSEGPNTTSYTWGGLSPGTHMCFTVHAVNQAGSSTATPAACATTAAVANQPPGNPTGLTATAISPTQIKLEWRDNSPDEDGFYVSNGTATEFSVTANTTSYIWGGFQPGTYSCFHVQAFRGTARSAWTDFACTTTPTTLPQIPAAPSNPRVTAISSTTMRVEWTDNSANENGFVVSDAVAPSITLPANTTTYTWEGLAPGTYKCIHIHAFNQAGISAWTDYACTTTPT